MSKKPTHIPLTDPVIVDGKEVAEVTLRKPNAGELRGLQLVNVLQMDVTTMITLLPRITQPPLDGNQVANLDPADLTALSVEAMLFFAKEGQMQALGLQV